MPQRDHNSPRHHNKLPSPSNTCAQGNIAGQTGNTHHGQYNMYPEMVKVMVMVMVMLMVMGMVMVTVMRRMMVMVKVMVMVMRMVMVIGMVMIMVIVMVIVCSTYGQNHVPASSRESLSYVK